MATDIAPGIVKKVQDLATTNGWSDVETSVQDMRDLSNFADETFTHVVTSFALVILKEQEDSVNATREMYRVLNDGGACMFQILWSPNPNFDLYA
jgi:ubiquinone/menaquinone biosynthesis C-methylase UbiE